MNAEQIAYQLSGLASAIFHLSQSVDWQCNYLQILGTWPSTDELALEFDDTVRFSATLLEQGVITNEIHELIRDLDGMLDKMSGAGNDSLWSIEGLSHTAWLEVRDLSKTIHNKLVDICGEIDVDFFGTYSKIIR